MIKTLLPLKIQRSSQLQRITLSTFQLKKSLIQN